jgi:hypothetical protein
MAVPTAAERYLERAGGDDLGLMNFGDACTINSRLSATPRRSRSLASREPVCYSFLSMSKQHRAASVERELRASSKKRWNGAG